MPRGCCKLQQDPEEDIERGYRQAVEMLRRAICDQSELAARPKYRAPLRATLVTRRAKCAGILGGAEHRVRLDDSPKSHRA
jgi:hypothetical protein